MNVDEKKGSTSAEPSPYRYLPSRGGGLLILTWHNISYILYAHFSQWEARASNQNTLDTINACSTRLLDWCQAWLMGWDPGSRKRDPGDSHGPVPMVSEPLFAKQPWFLWQALETNCTVLNSRSMKKMLRQCAFLALLQTSTFGCFSNSFLPLVCKPPFQAFSALFKHSVKNME